MIADSGGNELEYGKEMKTPIPKFSESFVTDEMDALSKKNQSDQMRKHKCAQGALQERAQFQIFPSSVTAAGP